MNPKSSRDELFYWCSQLKISPDEFSKMPYADLEEKFRKWKTLLTFEQLKKKKLKFIQNYAIKNLRAKGGSDAQCTFGASSEGYQGVLQAKVSLKDQKRNQQHNLEVEANTKLQGIDESQLMEILGTPGSSDISINRIQMSITEVGKNDTREFNIYRGGNGNLQVDCPNEWEDFVTNL